MVETGPGAHDRALALTSHLPHLVASALASPSRRMPRPGRGDYRDGTRVAAADTGLWAAIFLENRGPLLDALDRFDARLAAFHSALVSGDTEALRSWWAAGRELRRGFDPGPARLP